MKSGTGEKRRLGNRRNARRSTGPRTPEGKAAVRWNALKHGLLVRETLVKRGDGKENEQEFARLVSALEEDLNPVGSLEAMLVEFIATSYYRRGRVLRYEVAEIRSNLDNAFLDDHRYRRSEFRLALSLMHNTGSTEKLLDSSMGIAYLMAVLKRTRDEILETGDMSLKTWEKFDSCFRAQKLSEKCSGFVVSDPSLRVDSAARAREDEPKLDQSRVDFLEELEFETDRLESMRMSVETIEALARERRMGRGSLPSSEAIERVIRYETTIERQIYRAMNQLAYLQRSRNVDRVVSSASSVLTKTK